MEVIISKKECLIDKDFFEGEYSKYHWFITKLGYVRGMLKGKENVGKRNVLMSRLVVGLKRGNSKVCDHINGNILDNRRENLRICTGTENRRHVTKTKRGYLRNIYLRKTKYRGISYRVFLSINRKMYHKTCRTLEEAVREEERIRKENHGKFFADFRQNLPDKLIN